MKIGIAFFVAILTTLSAYSQSNYNLDFEMGSDSTGKPLIWECFGKGYDIRTVSFEKYRGTASLSIKSKTVKGSSDSVAVVMNRLDFFKKGKELELSGFLKLDDIKGRAGLSLVISGQNGVLSSEEMKGIRLNGTIGWKKYSIKLPLPDSATSIFFGLHLVGNGTLFADDIKLLIDKENAILKPNTAKPNSDDSKIKFYPKSALLLTDSVSKVSFLEDNYVLDSFYKKYLNACGLQIIGSKNVDDNAFYKVREVLLMMLQKLPDVKRKLIEAEIKIAIVGKNENLTDLPEYKSLPSSINQRARGLGASTQYPLTSCAEENVLCLEGDRYRGEDILIHEFAHTIQVFGISLLDKTFDKELEYIYSKAIAEHLWENTYAISNPSEYFAEGVQCWFNVNKYEEKNNGIHNQVNTQTKLKAYDPRLYDLLKKYFLSNPKNPSCSYKFNGVLFPWSHQN